MKVFTSLRYRIYILERMKYLEMPYILFFPILCFLFATQMTFAQTSQTGEVMSLIKGKGNQPVSYATVTLLKSSDSSLLKGVLSDERGAYHFEKVPLGGSDCFKYFYHL